MALLTETNAQYYSGQQAFTTAGGAGPHTFTCNFNTNLVDSPVANYTITNNGTTVGVANYSVAENIITITSSLVAGNVVIQLSQPAINNNYGSYEYIKLGDIINNFIVGYRS